MIKKPSSTTPDVVVVGAGPAGLAAAGTAASRGLSVLLLDEQPHAGGQIYRSIGQVSKSRLALLGPDYAEGQRLLAALDEPRVTHVPGATVWQLEPDRTLFYSVDGVAHKIQPRHVILATGALERPTPFPGWTLPGVMSAGAVQILLKSSGVVPEGPLILAGAGPLLLLLAAQVLRAGVKIAAIVETVGPYNRAKSLLYAVPALGGYDYLFKGAALMLEVARHGVPWHHDARDLEAVGTDNVTALRFRSGLNVHEVPCTTCAVHTGVVPNTQLSRSLRLEHHWDSLGRSWRPQVDAYGSSELDGIAIAGDGAVVGGALVAAFSGELAGLSVAARLGKIDAQTLSRTSALVHTSVRRHMAVRPFLDALYAPDEQFLNPAPETIVCRCEEVRASDVREYVRAGALGPNQAKAYGRCGMGPCQGRFCGLTVSEIIAAERNVSPQEVGYYRIRSPIKPVTLGEVASLDEQMGLASAGRVI